MPRVLVVDDHRVFAEALAHTLATEADIDCAAPASSAEEALTMVLDRCPDVVLLDVNLPGMSGIDALPQLLDRCPDACIILLTAGVSGERLLQAVENGVCGFLRKDRPMAELVRLVREADGRMIADEQSLSRILDARRPGDGSDEPIERLTAREHEVLLLLADSVSVKQIAQRFGITVHTCRGHVREILRKFDAHSQLEAVIIAARQGLLPNLRVPHE